VGKEKLSERKFEIELEVEKHLVFDERHNVIYPLATVNIKAESTSEPEDYRDVYRVRCDIVEGVNINEDADLTQFTEALRKSTEEAEKTLMIVRKLQSEGYRIIDDQRAYYLKEDC